MAPSLRPSCSAQGNKIPILQRILDSQALLALSPEKASSQPDFHNDFIGDYNDGRQIQQQNSDPYGR